MTSQRTDDPEEALHLLRDMGLILDGAGYDQVRHATGRRCSRCGISDSVDSILLDMEGVCSECLRFEALRHRLDGYFGSISQLAAIFAKNAATRRGEFDCLLLYSGGKDSTYTLYKLLDMGLKVRTFTFDNGFISRQALDNIRSVTTELGLTHTTATHVQMIEVLRQSLSRHSTVCKGCFKGLLDLSLELADREGIDLIVTGLSRGQIVEERLRHLYEQEEFNLGDVERLLTEGRKIYHTVEAYEGLDASRFTDPSILDRIHLIDYFRYSSATKEEIYRFLRARSAIWREPGDTGFCSSNCMVNDVGILVHKQERGFSNYEVSTAWDVRLGHLSRDAAVAELQLPLKNERLERMLGRIGHVPSAGSTRPSRRTLFCVLARGKSVTGVRMALQDTVAPGAIPAVVAVARIPRDAQGRVQYARLPSLRQSPAASVTAIHRAAPAARLAGAPSEDRWVLHSFVSPEVFDRQAWTRSLLQVRVQHPLLCAVAVRAGPEWSIECKTARTAATNWVDVRHLAIADRAAAVQLVAARMRDTAMKTGGTSGLVHFLVVANDQDGGSRVLILAHQLVVDDFSWTILCADLASAYLALRSGAPVRLPAQRAAEGRHDFMQEPPYRVASRPRPSQCGRVPCEMSSRDAIVALRATVSADPALSSCRWVMLVSAREPGAAQTLGACSRLEPLDDGDPRGAWAGDLPQFVCMVLPLSYPAPDARLFPHAAQTDRISVAMPHGWIVVREVEGGLQLTWGADPKSAADRAIGHAVHEVFGGVGTDLLDTRLQ